MLECDLLNRGPHLHRFILWLLLLQGPVEAGPAHRRQLTHPLDTQAALHRHHVPDVGVDALPPESPLRWRRAFTLCKAPLKKSTSSIFSAKTRLRRLTSLRRVLSREFTGAGPSRGGLKWTAPPIQQPPMDPELFGELHDILALLQPLHGHLPERLRIPPHSSFGHWPPPHLCPVCQFQVSQSRGSVHYFSSISPTFWRVGESAIP